MKFTTSEQPYATLKDLNEFVEKYNIPSNAIICIGFGETLFRVRNFMTGSLFLEEKEKETSVPILVISANERRVLGKLIE